MYSINGWVFGGKMILRILVYPKIRVIEKNKFKVFIINIWV